METQKRKPSVKLGLVFWRVLEVLGVIASIAGFILTLIKK
jgi:hypothetical protein